MPHRYRSSVDHSDLATGEECSYTILCALLPNDGDEDSAHPGRGLSLPLFADEEGLAKWMTAAAPVCILQPPRFSAICVGACVGASPLESRILTPACSDTALSASSLLALSAKRNLAYGVNMANQRRIPPSFRRCVASCGENPLEAFDPDDPPAKSLLEFGRDAFSPFPRARSFERSASCRMSISARPTRSPGPLSSCPNADTPGATVLPNPHAPATG